MWSNGRSISRWPFTDPGTFASAEVEGYGFWFTYYDIGRGKGRGCAETDESDGIRVNKGFGGQPRTVTSLIQEGDIQTELCPLYGTNDIPWGP